MSSVIQFLESFNRKERFFLIGEALGNPEFRLAKDFRTKLGNELGLPIPADAFVAMDYHLDWIHASVFLASTDYEDPLVYPNDEGIATGTQEDVDLIVGFEDAEITYLLLVEAKAETGWNNKQLRSKACRLRKIFGAKGKQFPRVKPYFLLMSPRRPIHIDTTVWPSWMTRDGDLVWMELKVKPGRRRITRTTGDGNASMGGKFFRVSQELSWQRSKEIKHLSYFITP